MKNVVKIMVSVLILSIMATFLLACTRTVSASDISDVISEENLKEAESKDSDVQPTDDILTEIVEAVPSADIGQTETVEEVNISSESIFSEQDADLKTQSAGSVKKDGFVREGNVWVFYANGKKQDDKTGLVKGTIKGSTGWYYVVKGVFNKSTGLTKKAGSSDKNWYYAQKGRFTKATGMTKKINKSDDNWYFVYKGTFTKTDGITKKLKSNDKSWYYVQNGTFKRSTGITKKALEKKSEWYYVENGKFKKTTGVTKKLNSEDSKLYYVKKGVFDRSTGLSRQTTGGDKTWYYVKKGAVSDETGVVKKIDGKDKRQFLVQNGKLANHTGYLTINGKEYYFVDGVRVKPSDGVIEGDGYIIVAGKMLTPETKRLDLSGLDLQKLNINMRKVLRYCKGMKRVYLLDCGLTNDQYARLQDKFPNVKIVWEIRLSHWRIRTDAVGFSTFKSTIDNFFLEDNEAYYLKYCTELVGLDIGHNHVTDLSFLKYMPDLKMLILVDNFTSYGGRLHHLEDLSVLKYNTKLRYLEVFVSDCSDFSFMDYLPDIEDLNISYSNANSIEHFMNMDKLQRMWLEHTNISYDDYQKLVKRYPNAKIVYYGSGSIDQGWRTGSHYTAMRELVKYNYVPDVFK